MKVNMRYILIVLSLCVVISVHAEELMPDSALQKAVWETLGIPAHVPLTPAHLQSIRRLDVPDKGIVDLTGLEHATHCSTLILEENEISDISPLSGLTKLAFLDLSHNQISDIRPLVGLTGLGGLKLANNQIVDISPLAGLVNLDLLNIANNRITDFSPLAGLNLQSLNTKRNISVDLSMINTSKITNLMIDAEEVCIIDRPPIVERIENRSYPSISGFGKFHFINRPGPDDVWEWSYHKEMLAYHDLFMTGTAFRSVSTRHFPQLQLVVEGPLWYARQERNEVQELNPNFLLLASLDYYGTYPTHYPEDWPYWLRDKSGNIIEDEGFDALVIDYTLPGAEDHLIQQALAIAKCGIFDGLFMDWWGENEDNEAITGVDGAGHLYHGNRADALVSLVRRIREVVGDDFLILVNTDDKIPRSAPYINGAFMETLYDGRTGIGKAHAREHFIGIENALLWFEENFRYPQVNFLAGFSIASEPPDSPENQRQARAFTTLSLTHSDGYVAYLPTHYATYNTKYWYDLYDAPLGRSVGGDETKGQLYGNSDGVPIEGLFIREFTNGWSVYNRSGKEQQIEFSEAVSGIASGVKEKRSHMLPDLDGEIYLKSIAGENLADVNGDGIVNILDLVVVANAFGKDTPDVNGDSVVNVLDLVAVANAFE